MTTTIHGSSRVVLVFDISDGSNGSPSLSENEFGRMGGRIIMYGWFLVHYTQVVLAINRFMAINCPVQYNAFFSSTNTKRLLVVLGIYLLWYFLVGFIDGCHFIFLQTNWQWTFEQTQCGLILGLYLDFYFTIGLVLISTIIDLRTAISIYHFVKSCMSNVVFIVDLSLFFLGPTIYQGLLGKTPDTFGTFVINTLTMEAHHGVV
ncbi:hypothetical protein Y032_0824g2546 [Ancylostoma ceylanicum]|uniref:7TM GPCR serpentine receptor class x (Srx) domain-containing protein n=1 Tax=Ancylostoma ceylanicum TaxID=53326 RepID=A0A016WDQ8_9BILA|nr:hypothetical protein Y032_0824g2546 [Ancylostoma ceylanicum]